MEKMVESLVVEFDQAKYEEFLSSGSKSPKARQYRKVSLGIALESALRSSQTRLARRMSWPTTSHVMPASTSPMRPTWLTLLMFSPFIPIPFLSTKLPRVPINPYGVTEMLSDDRDGVHVNYRHEKLEQLFAQQM